MNHVTLDSIAPLLEAQDETVLSIYCPTHGNPAPDNIREDQTRLKNLINQAKQKLSECALKDDAPKQTLASVESLIDDQQMWLQAAKGIGIFASKDNVTVYNLPLEVQERVSAGKEYDVAPLFAVCGYAQDYYVLALAVHEPKLFKGSAYSLEPVEIELPKSPEDALNIDELYSDSNTFRAANSGANGGKLSSHGQGDSREAGNEERLKFFRMVDAEIMNSKNIDVTLPFIIAGTQSEATEYRALSNLPYVLETRVDGNYTKSTLPELHALTWPAVESEINGKHKEELKKRYHDLVGAKKASHDLVEITVAADEGRVDTLLLGIISQDEDTVDDQSKFGTSMKRIIFPSQYNDEGIGKLIHKVIHQGGKIVGLETQKVPGGSVAAAIFRY